MLKSASHAQLPTQKKSPPGRPPLLRVNLGSGKTGVGTSDFRSMMTKYNKLLSEVKAGKHRIPPTQEKQGPAIYTNEQTDNSNSLFELEGLKRKLSALNLFRKRRSPEPHAPPLERHSWKELSLQR